MIFCIHSLTPISCLVSKTIHLEHYYQNVDNAVVLLGFRRGVNCMRRDSGSDLVLCKVTVLNNEFSGDERSPPLHVQMAFYRLEREA